ncbi:MAG TPA: glycosyltransferase family 39 protein [Candidatus Acidoferrales bacterium]|nr:glycosyltransferase family 39 protein [Candidatus Acidoferrales bacterium]
MAVRKVKKRGAPAAALLPAEPAGSWQTRIRPFLDRHALALVVCLVLLATLRIVSTYSELSLTIDEPEHFAAGLQYLSSHVYNRGWEHPPLARVAAAMGPYLAGVRPTFGPRADLEGVDLIRASGQVDRMSFLIRAGILPFFWIACIIVYLWASRFVSAGVGAIATGLFTLTPPVLAHAGLATTDMALTACLPAAFLALLVWAESPAWQSAAVLGVAAALAALSKFTALGYLPATAALSLGIWLSVRRPSPAELARLARQRLATFGFAVVVGCMVVWAAYCFSFGAVVKWGVNLPAPEFFDGILNASAHNGQGHPGYLLGETSLKGWWYFFPVALAVKTPLAILLLAVPGVAVVWKSRRSRGYLTFAAFPLGVLLPAMTSHVNIGVRHVLPIYAGISILAALGISRLPAGATTAKAALIWIAAPLVWLAVSGILMHPDYLAYFNALAGREPEKILVDSDLDWAQETKRLQRRLREVHAGHVAIKFAEAVSYPLYDLGKTSPIDPVSPSPGWNVLSPTAWKHPDPNRVLHGTDLNSLIQAEKAPEPWYDRVSPTERVGALLLFYFPPDSPLLRR